ncbi:MAG: PCYCGC motif-containing (lipo)protein [Gemmatimonadaceae bacterium]
MLAGYIQARLSRIIVIEPSISRRRFFTLMPIALYPWAADGVHVRDALRRLLVSGKHPTPRPGITASRVLTAKRLKNRAAAPVYAMVRKIPQVIDGIRCYCGCADLEGSYSLLTCYEEEGMAQHCLICQGEARLAYKLHADGWSLNGIRASIDAAFASSS